MSKKQKKRNNHAQSAVPVRSKRERTVKTVTTIFVLLMIAGLVLSMGAGVFDAIQQPAVVVQ